MKLRVDQQDLSAATGWTAHAVPTRPHHAVWAGILVEATADHGVVLVGGDGDLSARRELPSAAVLDEGRLLVPGRLLAEVTKAMPTGTLELSADGNRLIVVGGTTRFSLPLLTVEDYPTPPAPVPVAGTVEGALFTSAVAQVAVAAGRTDALPALTGLSVRASGDRLTLAATDRYRLAVREIPWSPQDPASAVSGLIPARDVADFARTVAASDQVELGLSAGGRSGRLAGPVATVSIRLLDGAFPDYTRLQQAAAGLTTDVEVADLADAVRRVMVVTPDAVPIRLTLQNGSVELSGQAQLAQSRDEIAAHYDGPPFTIAFNPRYLLDALAALAGHRAHFTFGSDGPEAAAHKPVTVAASDGDDDGYRHLLMPVRTDR